MEKKPYLKISARFHLHNLPDGHLGLVGENINFNHKGTATLSMLIENVLFTIIEYYENAHLETT